jgi:acetylglutamate kinase
MNDNLENSTKAEVLLEALPYIKDFGGETFVIKFGGSINDKECLQNFCENVALLKSVGINIVVVHGGGPQIDEMLDKLKIHSKFVEGLRVTDDETIEVVEMVLCGKVNKQIVAEINKISGVMAIGLSGKDGNLIKADKIGATYKKGDSNLETIVNLGYVGKPSVINIEVLNIIEETNIIPVIAPVGFGSDGKTYNMNADTVAGALAVALNAKKLILLTDVDGVLDQDKSLISVLTEEKVKSLISKGVIKSGMIPKVNTGLNAVLNGVDSVHIINGSKKNALLLELLTKDGTGTMIIQDQNSIQNQHSPFSE